MARYLLPFIAILALLPACGGSSNGGPVLPLWGRFEERIDAPVDQANPFDPAQADVQAEFRAPSGNVTRVAAFVTRDYTRQLVNGREQLTPAGDRYWQVRFTPSEQGDWRWRPAVAGQAGDWRRFTVGAPAVDSHGFLRRNPDDSRYLQFDDGTPYFAIGENLAWYDARGTYAYDQWFDRLAAQGANYVRLWMPSWAFGLEWTGRTSGGVTSSLGNYSSRLDRAWQLDQVLDAAQRHGISVVLVIWNHGPFSLTSNSEWGDNPYNVANGGPLSGPRQFFTDPEARRLQQQLLRYIVARWGHSPNLLAWELWNEVDLTDQPSVDEVVAWHRETAQTLRNIDPYGHLITTSLSEPWGIAVAAKQDLASVDAPLFRLWQIPEIDIVQAHLYTVGGIQADFTDAIPRIVANLQRFGKPVLVGEVGVDYRGPAETLAADPHGSAFHDFLWSGLFSESAGTGMSWWWDNVVDPQDWYYHLGPLASVLAGQRLAGMQAEAATAEGAAGLRAWLLLGPDGGVAWVKNVANQWFSPDGSTISGATLRLPVRWEGSWTATWVDTYGGGTMSTVDVESSGGETTLDIPDFARDIALRLERH